MATRDESPARSSKPPEHLQDVVVAAAVAGACLSTVLSPFELVKCR